MKTFFKFLGFILSGHSTQLTIAVDYDGTIVKDGCFPEAGEMRPKTWRVLKWIDSRRHLLILNTCRCNDYEIKEWKGSLDKALENISRNEIRIFCVNENHPKTFGGAESRKISADLYIDDKSLMPWAWWMVPPLVLWREYLKFKKITGYKKC